MPSGSDRADFVFLTKDQLSRRYPNVSLAGLPERGGAGLALAGGDIAAAEKAIGNAGVRSGDGVLVAPAAANGVLLAFAADYDRDVSPRSRNGPAYDTDGFSGGISAMSGTTMS